MTLSDKALTTLENIKLYLGIPDAVTTNDNLLIEFINIASDTLQNSLIKRDLGIETRTEEYEGTGTQSLILNNYPIVTVDEVKICDDAITDYTIPNPKNGMLRRRSRWPESGYAVGLSKMLQEKFYDIEVTYTAGYVLPKDAGDPTPVRTLPWDIEGLCKRMVSSMYNTAGNEGLDSFSISDVSWDWAEMMTEKDMAVIGTYRKVRF